MICLPGKKLLICFPSFFSALILVVALIPKIKISYLILAPTIIPKGFVDARQISEKLIKSIQIDEQEYRFGNTKVSKVYIEIFPQSKDHHHHLDIQRQRKRRLVCFLPP